MRDRAVELDENFSEALAPPPVSRRRGRRADRGGGSAPESIEKVHAEIVSGVRYAGASAADEPRRRKRRAGRGKSQFADVNFPGRRSAGERARARRATYLDLGRLEGGDRAGEGGGNAGHFGVVKGCGVWCVCGNDASIAAGRCFVRCDFANSEDFLPSRFLPYGEAVTFSRRKRFCARGADFVPTGTTKSRLATKRRFVRFPSGVENRHLELRIKIDIAFFPFKRAISRNRRPVKRREKRGSKKPRYPIVFSDANPSAISVRSWLFQRSRLALHGQ